MTALFLFALGPMLGVTSPTASDMVGVTLTNPSGGARFTMDMSSTEARAMANALYEAAEASEAMLPVTTVRSLEGVKPEGSA